MAVTNIDGLLEAWANQAEAMEQNYETIYGAPAITPTLPAVTTEEGLLEAIADEAEKAVKNVAIDNSAYYDNATNAYAVSIPAGLVKWYGVKKIGGKTIVWNQLMADSDVNVASVPLTITDGVFVYSGTPGSNQTVIARSFTDNIVAGEHKHLLMLNPINEKKITYKIAVRKNGAYVGSINTLTSSKIITTTAEQGGGFFTLVIGVTGGTTYDEKIGVGIFDLTLMFGAGNEPSTVEEFESMFGAEPHKYNAGELVSAEVTQITSKDSDNNTVDTLVIPDEVQALTGYGWSCPSFTNYIDFEAKKYYQYVGERAHIADDDSDSTVITDGTTTHYELDTAVETDISAYLTDTDINVVASGTVTFENQLGDDYKIPVLNEVEYIAI